MAFLAPSSSDGSLEGIALRAGLTVLESGVLGAITLVAITVAVWSVWKLSEVQERRVRDLEKGSERMERVITKLSKAVSEFSSSLDQLAAAEQQGQTVLRQLEQALNAARREDRLPLPQAYTSTRGPDEHEP